MFEDDPEMQALVARAAAEPKPAKQPFYFQIVLTALMLLGAAAAGGATFVLGWSLTGAVIPCGLLAGGLVAMTLLGSRPGRYRVIETDEKLTLWTPLAPLWRGLMGVGSLVVLGVGFLIAYSDAPAPGPGAHGSSAPAEPAAAPSSPKPSSAPARGAPTPAGGKKR